MKQRAINTQTMTRVLPILLVVFVLSPSSIDASNPRYLNDTRRIPEIQEGQPCVKGQVYRMKCNTCHCSDRSSLICTKMACFDPEQVKKMRSKSLSKAPKSLTEAPKSLRAEEKDCTPGKFYKKGCKKCFCTEKRALKCSAESNCKLVDKVYTNPDHIHPYSPTEFYQLPPLPHQGTECQAGLTYRIDCNVCFCLATGNLMCQKLLCPSYDDVYRIKATEMSAKPCKSGETISEDCLQCNCVSSKYACETNPVCKHSDGRRMLHGEYPSDNDRNFINLDGMMDDCDPGMVYKVHCNKCYCQEDRSLRCTQKTCLNFDEVQQLKKLRLKLESGEKD